MGYLRQIVRDARPRATRALIAASSPPGGPADLRREAGPEETGEAPSPAARPPQPAAALRRPLRLTMPPAIEAEAILDDAGPAPAKPLRPDEAASPSAPAFVHRPMPAVQPLPDRPTPAAGLPEPLAPDAPSAQPQTSAAEATPPSLVPPLPATPEAIRFPARQRPPAADAAARLAPPAPGTDTPRSARPVPPENRAIVPDAVAARPAAVPQPEAGPDAMPEVPAFASSPRQSRPIPRAAAAEPFQRTDPGPPELRIGQVDVFLRDPSPSRPAPASSAPRGPSPSRLFLRRL